LIQEWRRRYNQLHPQIPLGYRLLVAEAILAVVMI
jgi:hypothetical protein